MNERDSRSGRVDGKELLRRTRNKHSPMERLEYVWKRKKEERKTNLAMNCIKDQCAMEEKGGHAMPFGQIVYCTSTTYNTHKHCVMWSVASDLPSHGSETATAKKQLKKIKNKSVNADADGAGFSFSQLNIIMYRTRT